MTNRTSRYSAIDIKAYDLDFYRDVHLFTARVGLENGSK